MKLQYFIDRPILSMVISVVILVAGLIGLYALSVEQYPDIAPPTIRVSTTYSGANAEAVQKSVIVPLEEAINGVENMTYMTSTASNTGSAEITVYFKQGSDPDMAAVNVQNKVSTATSLLPAEVTKVGVTTMKRQSSMLKIFGLYSPNGTYDEAFLTNYLSINIKPQIQRISGVGEVNVMGGDYAMRIWLKPDVMAQYELEPSDVEAALSSQNIEASTGAIGEDSKNVYQYTLKYRGRLEKEQEFEEIVIKAFDDGRVLRLKDIATVELGSQSYSYTGRVNGAPGATCMINQTAGTNANEIITSIDQLLDELQESLPEDMEIVELMSTKNFLDASINEVIKTLLEAIILVVLVVYVFLQNPRSTLIPAISIFVSLIGTFAVLYLAGFSINLLTLFALVLAIGTIVDDAIIVVEAVQVRFDEGYRSPYKASVDAMSGISSAIVTSTLVFMAVFVPVSFMGGTSGVFYTQFGITMAVAVGISAINALTLSPALCALLLRPNEILVDGKKPEFSTRFRLAFDAIFKRLVFKYKEGAKFFIKHKWLVWTSFAASVGLLLYLMATTKTSLVPSEDTGSIFVSLDTPAGSTLAETASIMESLLKVGEETENAVTQTRANLYELEATHNDLLRQQREAENALCTVLGVTPRSIERGQLAGQQFPEIFNVGVPLRLLSKRPDVREAEMTLASAYYTTNQARSAFYPNLTLTGSAGWTNALGPVVTNPGGWILSAVASLTQPIFNRGKLISNLRVSKDEEQIALLNYKQTLLDAGQEVSDALYAVESAQRNLEIHQKQCRELERTVETSEALYKTGNATYLELLTAQQSLLNARLNLVSDSFTHCQSIITLYNALGGGSN